MDDALSIWTIYDHPLDYDGFIARRFNVYPGTVERTNDVRTGATLEDVRSQLPPNLYPLDRTPLDEPQIVESWI